MMNRLTGTILATLLFCGSWTLSVQAGDDDEWATGIHHREGVIVMEGSEPAGKGGSFLSNKQLSYDMGKEKAKAGLVEFLRKTYIEGESGLAKKDDENKYKFLVESKFSGELEGLLFRDLSECKYDRDGSEAVVYVRVKAPLHGGADAYREITKELRSIPAPEDEERMTEPDPAADTMAAKDEVELARPSAHDHTGAPTGIIVDATGTKLGYGMYPRILTKEKTIVYDVRTPDEETVYEEGVAKWATSVDEAKTYTELIGNNPVVVVAAKAKGKNKTDAVVTPKDANLLLRLNSKHQLLKDCKIVFVVRKL